MQYRARLHRLPTPALVGGLLLSACSLPDLGPTDSNGTTGADTGDSDGADSTAGVPTDCMPLGQDEVASDITLPAGCYHVSATLAIESRLELEPGVEMVFDANAGLSVFGTGVLSALGTAGQPVTMAATGDQGWQGVLLLGSASSDNRLQSVWISDPAADGVIVDGGSRLQVSGCQIVGATGTGLVADPGAQITVDGTTIEDGGLPLSVGIEGVVGIAADNVLTANAEPFVEVVGGALTDAAQWVAPGVPLRLTGDAHIEAALELGAGLEIEMPQDSQWRVSSVGSLTVEGTADAPVAMRGVQDERGYWRGLGFESNDSANVLRHAVIANGGSDGWNGSEDSVAMVWMEEQSRLELHDCTLRRSDGAALTSFGDADLAGFADNVIEDNRQTLKVSPDMVAAIEASTMFVGNDESYVRVGRPGANNATIAAPASWPGLSVPYRIIERFFVEADWTIAPGAVVEVMQDVHVIIEPGGTLAAVGTEAEPIAFVGAEALPGYWKGLEIQSVSADNELRHVQLRHAGSSGFNGSEESVGALFIAGVMALADSVVSDSGGHGVVVWNDGQLQDCGNVSFEGIADANVYVSPNGASSACP